jgi:hypothetical protein
MNRYTVREPWVVDGNLLPRFRELGYHANVWIPGRVRTLPESLALAAQSSGCVFAPATENMPEDDYREPVQTHAPKVDFRERYAKEPRLKVMLEASGGGAVNFVDGSLSPYFGALDMQPYIGLYEIVSLPLELIKKCEASGAKFSNDFGDYADDFHQAKHRIKREQYKAELEAKRQAQQAEQAQRLRATGTKGLALSKIAKSAKLTPEEMSALGLI